MKKIVIIFLAMVTITGLQSCQSTKSATSSRMLKFNFEKGKGYDYEMIINMDQEVMNQKMQMDMTTYYSMDVVADDGNTKTLTTTYDRFKMNMTVMGMNVEVDTDHPLQELGEGKKDPMKMLNGLLGAIKGRKFTMKVNQEGRIESVEGFKDMAESIVDSMHLDEAQRQQMVQQFSKQFNDKNIKDQFERVLYIFPNKEVKVGDSWQKVTNPGAPMAGKYTSTYTVTDIEGDMVTLEEKSKIESDSETVKLSGDITGTLVVDSKSGLVVSADQDMDITTATGGQSIKMIGKTKIKGKVR